MARVEMWKGEAYAARAAQGVCQAGTLLFSFNAHKAARVAGLTSRSSGGYGVYLNYAVLVVTNNGRVARLAGNQPLRCLLLNGSAGVIGRVFSRVTS
jgi:hypothetical protein